MPFPVGTFPRARRMRLSTALSPTYAGMAPVLDSLARRMSPVRLLAFEIINVYTRLNFDAILQAIPELLDTMDIMAADHATNVNVAFGNSANGFTAVYQALLTCVSMNGEPGHGPSELGSAMNQIRSEVTEDEPRYVKRNHMMW